MRSFGTTKPRWLDVKAEDDRLVHRHHGCPMLLFRDLDLCRRTACNGGPRDSFLRSSLPLSKDVYGNPLALVALLSSYCAGRERIHLCLRRSCVQPAGSYLSAVAHGLLNSTPPELLCCSSRMALSSTASGSASLYGRRAGDVAAASSPWVMSRPRQMLTSSTCRVMPSLPALSTCTATQI